MHSRKADLLTVAGAQELGSFWERMIQPQVFAIMLARYGGTEVVNESRRATEKIANGQCIFVTRAAYTETGGHGAVRDKVAEDLAMAQLWFTLGRRSFLVLGLTQLSTRMYTSLRELVEGWGKNIYAGGRDTVPFGAFGLSGARGGRVWRNGEVPTNSSMEHSRAEKSPWSSSSAQRSSSPRIASSNSGFLLGKSSSV